VRKELGELQQYILDEPITAARILETGSGDIRVAISPPLATIPSGA
jgi:hypothetical protein